MPSLHLHFLTQKAADRTYQSSSYLFHLAADSRSPLSVGARRGGLRFEANKFGLDCGGSGECLKEREGHSDYASERLLSCSLHARPYPKCLPVLTRLILTATLRGSLSSPFCRRGHQGPENLCYLPKVTQPKGNPYTQFIDEESKTQRGLPSPR